jgi:hypothetical protein
VNRRIALRLITASVVIGAGTAVTVHELKTAQAAPASGGRHLRGAANLMTPADITAPTASSGDVVWTEWNLATDPTLACQGAYLNDLGGTLLLRKLQTAAGHEANAPVVREGVLEFDTTAEATAAYDTVSGWLTTCPATLFSNDQGQTGPLSTDQAPEPRSAAGFVGVWQRSVLPNGQWAAPTYDQFVGRSGTRILIFEYSRGVGTTGTDVPSPFFASLDQVARRAGL